MSESTDDLEAALKKSQTSAKNAREARARLQAAIDKAEAWDGELSEVSKEIIRKAKHSLEPIPEYPRAKASPPAWRARAVGLAIVAGLFWWLFRYGVPVETLIGALIGASCGYAYHEKKHRAAMIEANRRWSVRAYSKDHQEMYACVTVGMGVGMAIGMYLS